MQVYKNNVIFNKIDQLINSGVRYSTRVWTGKVDISTDCNVSRIRIHDWSFFLSNLDNWSSGDSEENS